MNQAKYQINYNKKPSIHGHKAKCPYAKVTLDNKIDIVCYRYKQHEYPDFEKRFL